MSSPQLIRLLGVRQNNLKNIQVELPLKKLTVITGLSGSGKSSLAFDTLYAEGQRRYVESLSTYTRQFLEKMPKPLVEHVENIPPSIALEQRNTVVNSRSTVATQTDILDYLRVLFARFSIQYCADCGGEIKQVGVDEMLAQCLKFLKGEKGAVLAQVPTESMKPKNFVSYVQILKEQGFRRLVALPQKPKNRSKNPPKIIDLDDKPVLSKILGKGEKLFIVVDRFVIPPNRSDTDAGVDRDLKSRIQLSVQQALRLGNQELQFLNLDSGKTLGFHSRFACVRCGKEALKLQPQHFSFNHPLGACGHCSGFGFTLDLDESLIVPDPQKTLKNGAIDPFSKPSLTEWQDTLFRFAEKNGISIGKKYSELTASQKKLFWEGSPEEIASEKNPLAKGIFPGIRKCFEQLARKKYKLHVRVFIRRYQTPTLCTQCNGARIRTEALNARIGPWNIDDFLRLPIQKALKLVENLPLQKNQTKPAHELVSQVTHRLHFLDAVGVGYLTLNRQARTLSGGEFQRILLATQLGHGLCGTLYVLDEPSIGLHAADTSRLIKVLKELRDLGNTVVVVEHDLDIMRAADHLVEMGPGAGKRGGEIIAEGDFDVFKNHPLSLTARYLKGDFFVGKTRRIRGTPRHWLRIVGCKENNLKNLDISLPLERFVTISGVSGSGKSTFLHKTLYPALLGKKNGGVFSRLYGAERVREVVMLDQQPIGKNSRSNPATYLKAWDEFRKIFANQMISIRRGYGPQHFSFNVDGGRCPVCRGEGEVHIEMQFMAEISLPCEECLGKRFKKPVLDVLVKGRNIHQILNTTIDEAYDLFRDNSVLARKLGILREVGLGYLQVGQPAPTLSGGECQRLKIAAILDERSQSQTIYLFDEPTTGLHQEDVQKLLTVLQDLVEARNSVIMIEHHLDVIAQADWVLDLGPDGGESGGRIVGEGAPETVAKNQDSMTGQMLVRSGFFPPIERKWEEVGSLN